MLLKESWVNIADNTNVRWVKIFHLYKGFHRKSTKEGYFIKSSARVVEPPRIEYKGFKYKYSIKGDINRLLIIRVNFNNKKKDHSTVKVYTNNGIIIKKLFIDKLHSIGINKWKPIIIINRQIK